MVLSADQSLDCPVPEAQPTLCGIWKQNSRLGAIWAIPNAGLSTGNDYKPCDEDATGGRLY